MKMNVARWIVCSAACMAVGCSALERHIRPSEQATACASPDTVACLGSSDLNGLRADYRGSDNLVASDTDDLVGAAAR